MSLPKFSSDDLVLVTGATGFIASWVVAYSLQAGARVRGTVRDPTNTKKTAYLMALPGAADRLELVALDLLGSSEEAFGSAVQGCTMVAHTASPFPSATPKDENELIKPAVEGTLGVLRACKDSTSIRAVVVTSSIASTSPDEVKPIYGEQDWTNVETAAPYPKSKTMAERAAWDFFAAHNPKWTLCTINPCFVLGPSLSPELAGTSTTTAMRLLDGKMPMVPRVNFSIVDVRDVARAHLLALGKAVQGRRFILSHENLWFLEMADAVRPEFEPMGYSIAKREAPYFLLWGLSFFDAGVATVLPQIGKVKKFDGTPCKEGLGIEYIGSEKTLRDAAHALVFHGHLKKEENYVPPSPEWTPLTS